MAHRHLHFPSAAANLVAVTIFMLVWAPVGVRSDGPDMAECGPQLLLLAPCAPFVQGTMEKPIKSCCDNLGDLFSQQPKCLCLLLQDNSLPINQTLALHLPLLCNLRAGASGVCPGLINLPSLAPGTPAIRGNNPNSSIAAAPTTTLSPSTAVLSSGGKMNPKATWVLITSVCSVILKVVIRC